MKSSYKRIGDYIRLIDQRNTGLKVSLLLGLTIAKRFIPSVANIIGTDMENYKIIRKNQFACSLMQVRRDGKMPVALLSEYDEAIISQAYPVFEIIDESQLLPEYLMMWFSREEFDREACFYAIGGVRGSLEWEDFCNMGLPVPDITEQRAIVDEYHVIQERIRLNETMISQLEDTAQALYREWFVDYEFPDESGKPYKSSGGVMEYSEELGKEIPKGWRVSSLSNIANYMNGLAMQNYEPSSEENFLPVIKIRELNLGKTDESSGRSRTDIPKNYIIENGDVIFSWSGSLVIDIWSGGKGGLNQHLFKVTSKNYPKWFYYWWTKHHLSEFIKIADGNKTSMGHIKREHLDGAKVLIPTDTSFIILNEIMSTVLDQITIRKFEQRNTHDMKDLILSKMASVG